MFPGPLERYSLAVMGEAELHPPHFSFDLPVGPAPIAIEAVRAKRGINIRREPCSRAARCREPFLRHGHEPVTDAFSLVLWQYGDDQEFSRRAIGHGECDDPIGVVTHPALGGLAEVFRDALRVDAEPFQFLERQRVLARSRANVKERWHIGGSDLAELHGAHSNET